MAIKLVQVRPKGGGPKTFLPETALQHFPGYVKTGSQKARDEIPDGTAFPTETSDDESADTTTQAPSASDKRS